MNVILLGPPGSGKGTQAEHISKTYKIPHISTGDIIRENIKNETILGKKAKEFVESGKLVPDDLIIRLMRKRMNNPDASNGFLLDGFPRTQYQAEELDKLTEINYVISLEVKNNLLVKRISRRLMCKCGATYHLDWKKPAHEGKCDRCGEELYQRADDKEDTVRHRLEVYAKETAPLIKFYKKRHILHAIDGSQKIEKVFHDIKVILD